MTKPLTIVEKLKDSYSFLGDPLHREAWEEIERLQEALQLLTDFREARIKTTEGNHTMTGGNIGKFVEGK